ncbi:MAG TPA: hypothetical protein VF548_08595 [Allosphingosinicella sp.]|jgi:hypothetical protein
MPSSRSFAVLLALTLALLVPAGRGFACPGALPDEPAPPPRIELVKRAAERKPNIVYAVVEKAIGAYSSGEQRRRVRILHSYKGNMRTGQRLWTIVSQVRSECAPGQPAEIEALEGSYGLLLLPDIRDGDPPLEMPEFLSLDDARNLIRAGIIRSARETGPRERSAKR